jgi:hypothetical protein
MSYFVKQQKFNRRTLDIEIILILLNFFANFLPPEKAAGFEPRIVKL